jgi:hypothetical protein
MRAGRLSCGDVITKNTTLVADIGPCPGNGIIIGADNIRLNLNGHTISGTPGPGDGNAAGIRLPFRTGVTITGHPGKSGKTGTVTGFDAGLVVNGGSGNTIENLVVRDNIGPDDPDVALGDGIVLVSSANNRITNNVVAHNGTYDGIGVLGLDSNGNSITGNVVEDNVGVSSDAAQPGYGTGIIVNAFFEPNEPRRGESIRDNEVVGNVVRRNVGAGISNISNINGITARNIVESNGGNGIGVSHLFNAVRITNALVEENEVHGNGTDGIRVASLSNRILNNDAANNAEEGEGWFDLADRSSRGPANCDNNVWSGNIWGSGFYSPACTAAGGSGPALPTEGPEGDPSCSDGRDNDLDGLRDVQDPDCGDVTRPVVEGPAGDPTCSDGIDNDRDGATDRRDSDCGGGGVIVTPLGEGPAGDPSCSDGIDNDSDGAIDGRDSDCVEDTPIGEEPIPIGEEPTPIGEEPTPIGEEPTPIGEEPTPIGEEPTPIGEEPTPTEPTPTEPAPT